MKPVALSPSHYAASWTHTPRPVRETNQLGIEYARLPDGAEKEARLLAICEAFHGYIMKYLIMIRAGEVPLWGSDDIRHDGINKDVKEFIKYFLPKGTEVNRGTLRTAARHFHLAFKAMRADEVYAVLTEMLVSAIAKYDPDYTKKVKTVVEKIDNELSQQQQFKIADVSGYLGFDGDRYVRMLCRRGLLTTVIGKGKRIAGFERSATWPPPPEFFESGPIGFTYYIQTWFRFNLQAWIDNRMSQLESREGCYSWDFRLPNVDTLLKRNTRSSNTDGCFIRATSDEVVGTYSGHNWKRQDPENDDVLNDRPLDVSRMDLEWVSSTEDPLFKDLDKNERLMLYFVFNREMDMNEVARSIGCPARDVRRRLDKVLAEIRMSASQVELEKQA